MPTLDEARRLAAGWCDAWNRRDLDAVMAHYADDIAFSSPTVVARWGQADGWLRSHAQLRDHFEIGLRAPNLHFTLVDVLLGVGTICVLYRRETGMLVCDTLVIDATEKASCSVTCYAEDLAVRQLVVPAPVVPAPVVTAPVVTTPVVTPPVLAPVVVETVVAVPVVVEERVVQVVPARAVRPAIREVAVEADLARSRASLWALLTRPALIARWLLPNDFAPVVGHKFTFQAAPAGTWDGVVRCEVLEVEPENRLSYRWGTPGQDALSQTIVTWTLADADRRTRLRLVHAGLVSQFNDAAYSAMYPDWHAMFARIERLT